MKEKIEIREMLKKYRRYNHELDETGGPAENGELFETVIRLEEDILTAVDLPPAQKYRSILWGENIDEVIHALNDARKEYEDRPIKDPMLLLVYAVINHDDDPQNILPLAGFSLHMYQEFMFSTILLTSSGPAEADSIIEEMRKAESILNDLGLIGIGGIKKNSDLYRSLLEAGMHHLDEYLIANDTFDLDESEMDGRQLCLRGLHRAGRGMVDESIGDLTRALEHMPDLGTIYYNRAVLFEKKGDMDAAIADYDEAIRLDHDDAKAYCNRGLIRAERDMLEEALEDFEKAVSLAPSDFHSVCNRGNVYIALGRHEEAIDDFTKAIMLKPGEAYLYCNRGVSYYQLGRKDRALEDFRKSMDMGSELAERFIREFFPEVRIEQ